NREICSFTGKMGAKDLGDRMMASQISFLQDTETASGKRTQGGIPTTDIVMSAHVGGNAEVFPQILALHVSEGSTVADVTWGKGVFWQNVPENKYTVLATDLKTGVDCRNLPYDD